MSSNLMDTEPGGRSNQYESIKTVTNPTAKEPGQLGHGKPTTEDAPSFGSSPATNQSAGANSNTHVSPEEKIRFGQAISEEGGVTGFTGPAGGQGAATTEGSAEGGGDEAQQRREQGYGGKNDMDNNVGA